MLEIDKLEEGQEVDRMIVLEVMGWKPWEGDYHRGPSGRMYDITGDDYEIAPFEPSTDIAAAWEVVEKLKELDWALEVSVTNKLPEGDSETYYCGLLRGDDNAPWREDFRHIQAWAATAPLAICHAALEAVKDNG